MKYKLINDNLKNFKGGTIPKIVDTQINISNKLDYINKTAPLYFNLDKNPIISSNDNLFTYDYEYKPESQVLKMDSVFNLRHDGTSYGQLVIPTLSEYSDNSYIYRNIRVNDLIIPYYLGKIHNQKSLFGRIKLLFQYYFNKITIKKEENAINLIDKLFVISEENILIGISKTLNNVVDKYIFINKFYEFLEMITWTPPTLNIETLTHPDFKFENIPNGIAKNKKILQTNIKEKKFYDLGPRGNIIFDSSILKSTHLTPDEKNLYIKFITTIDYLLTKLKSIFYTDESIEINNAKLINLIDLYKGYTQIFRSEIEKKNSSQDNMKICNYVNIINKQNLYTSDINQVLYEEAVEIYNLIETLNEIKNWDIGYSIDKNNLNLHLILILSYFDLRVNGNQISQGRYINAIPINKNEAYENLFGNGRSFVQDIDNDPNKYHNTATYFSGYGVGPEINDITPNINIQENGNKINFKGCIENTIFQFIKCLFWDYNKKEYKLESLGLRPNDFLYDFMNKYIEINEDTDSTINQFSSYLINLPNIRYMENEIIGTNRYNYELTDVKDNFAKILLFLLKSRQTNIKINKDISTKPFDDILTEINTLIIPYDFEIEFEENSSNDDHGIFTLLKNKKEIVKVSIETLHGTIYKPITVKITEINQNTKNFLTYLRGQQQNTRTCIICPFLFNIENYVHTGTILTPYLNPVNIYWLNFIEDINLINNYFDTITDETIKDVVKLQFTQMINQILKIKIKNDYLYKLDDELLLKYLKMLFKIEYDETKIINKKLYEESDIFITDNLKFLQKIYSNGKNILQQLVTFEIDINYNSLVYICQLIKSVDDNILWRYPTNSEQPINLFLNYYNNNILRSLYRKNINILIINLIDSDEKVLNDIVNVKNPRLDKLHSLPLYFVLQKMEIMKNYSLTNQKDYLDLLKLLVGSKKIILDKFNNIKSPLSYYLEMYYQLIDENTNIMYLKDYYITNPIRLLQTEENIFDEKQISLFYNVMVKYPRDRNISDFDDENFIDRLGFFLEHKLLINPDIEGNQPVFNSYTKYGSILYKFLNQFKSSDNTEFINYVLRCLYNDSLLDKTPTPLWGYLNNQNFNIMTYDSYYICPFTYYALDIPDEKSGLIPVNFFINEMAKLSNRNLITLLQEQNTVKIFKCLCDTDNRRDFYAFKDLEDFFMNNIRNFTNPQYQDEPEIANAREMLRIFE
jgi:hypothetical protein